MQNLSQSAQDKAREIAESLSVLIYACGGESIQKSDIEKRVLAILTSGQPQQPEERTITLKDLWHLLFPEGTDRAQYDHFDVPEWLDAASAESEEYGRRIGLQEAKLQASLKAEPISGPQQEPASPDPSRCTLCGASRIPLDREKTKFGVCTLIGCKDPLHDYHKEQAAATGPASQSAEPPDRQCKCGCGQVAFEYANQPHAHTADYCDCEHCTLPPTPASGAAQGNPERCGKPLGSSGHIAVYCGLAKGHADKCGSFFGKLEPVTPVGQSGWIKDLAQKIVPVPFSTPERAERVTASRNQRIEEVATLIRNAIAANAAPPVPHCPRCGSHAGLFLNHYEVCDKVHCYKCGAWFDLNNIDDMQQFFSPALPGKDIESLLDRLCNSEDKTYCQRGRNELREIIAGKDDKESK